MKSSIKKYTIFFLLLICFFNGSIFLFRAQLIELLAPPLLKKYNLSNITLDLHSLSLTKLRINSFGADFSTDSPSGTIQIKNGKLEYDFKQLSNKKIKQLTIEEVYLSLNKEVQNKKQKKVPLSSKTIKKIISSLQAISLPVDKIIIQRLILNYPNSPLPLSSPFSLEITSNKQNIEARVSLPIDANTQLHLTAVKDDQDFITIKFSHFTEQQQIQVLSADISDSQITGRIKLGLQHITNLFPAMFPAQYSTDTEASFTLQLEHQPVLSIKGEAVNISTPILQTEKLSFNVDATYLPDNSLHLSKNSKIQINGFTTKSASISQIEAGIGSVIKNKREETAITLTSSTPWNFKNIKSGTTTIEEFRITPPTKISSSNNQLTFLLQDDFKLLINKITTSGIQVTTIKIKPKNTTSNQITINEKKEITLPPLLVDEVKLQKDHLNLTCSPITVVIKNTTLEEKGIKSSLLFQGQYLKVNKKDVSVSLAEINGTMNIDNKQLNGTVTFKPELVDGNFTMNLSHDLITQKGFAKVNTQESLLFNQYTGISDLVSGLTLPLTVTGGNLDLAAIIKWYKKSLSGNADIQFSEGSGAVKDVPFEGMSLQQSLTFLPNIHSKHPGTITIDTIQATVPITDFNGKFELKNSPHGKLPTIITERFEGNTLEGSIGFIDVIYDPNLKQNTIMVQATDLNLATIVEIFKIKGLQVSGKVNGSIPLEISRKGVTVIEGLLNGTEVGGTIRYKPTGLNATQSQFTEFAMKALEEFHFTVLKAPVTYHPDGTLLISLQLQGKSPALSKTRPVHLNINTEQNLLSLVKSLKYNNSVLTEELKKRLQKK